MDLIEHSGLRQQPAVFKRAPFQLSQHRGDMTLPGIVVEYKSSCSVLDHFDAVVFRFLVLKYSSKFPFSLRLSTKDIHRNQQGV